MLVAGYSASDIPRRMCGVGCAEPDVSSRMCGAGCAVPDVSCAGCVVPDVGAGFSRSRRVAVVSEANTLLYFVRIRIRASTKRHPSPGARAKTGFRSSSPISGSRSTM